MLDFVNIFLVSVVVSIVAVWLYRSGLSFGKAVNFKLEKPRVLLHAKPRPSKNWRTRSSDQRVQKKLQGAYKTPWGW
jgi:hypothetical protein